jgi:hypothetical protein
MNNTEVYMMGVSLLLSSRSRLSYSMVGRQCSRLQKIHVREGIDDLILCRLYNDAVSATPYIASNHM